MSLPPGTSTHTIDGYTVHVSLPPAYGNGANRFDVLYILVEPDQPLFVTATEGARERHTKIKQISGRGWYPDFIVVAATAIQPASTEQLLRFCTSRLVGFMDQTYSTKPYAGGRSICSYSCDGVAPSAAQLALCNPEAASLFRFYLLGLPTAAVNGAILPEKTTVYLGVGQEAGQAAISAAEEAKAILDQRLGSGGGTQTLMKVDRFGEQHYEKQEVARADLTLDTIEPGELAGIKAFADRSVGWLGAQLEKQKHGSLASLFPWHEFR